jgi:ribosomal RNA-processing protein 9
MAPPTKKPVAPATTKVASKKRPHEAPVKGKQVFAGNRQKVEKGGGGGGGGGGGRGGGGGGRGGRGGGGGGGEEDPGDDDMLEDALDDAGDNGARRQRADEGGSDDEDEEVKETADEKRLRLAKNYLDKLRAEVGPELPLPLLAM